MSMHSIFDENFVAQVCTFVYLGSCFVWLMADASSPADVSRNYDQPLAAKLAENAVASFLQRKRNYVATANT